MRLPGTRLVMAMMLALLPGNAVAEANRPCLQPAEAQALFMYILPDAFMALSKHCAQSLPADALLRTAGPTLAAKYLAASNEAWPKARLAFAKLTDSTFLKLLDDATLKKLVSSGVTGQLPKTLKPEDCPVVDKFVSALEPLPARNMALLLDAFVQVGLRAQKGRPGNSPFTMCQPTPAPVAPTVVPVPAPTAKPQ